MALRAIELNLKKKRQTQIRAQLKSLRAKAKKLREDEAALQQKIDDAATTEDVEALEADVEQLAADQETTDNDIADLEEQLAAVEDAIEELGGEVEDPPAADPDPEDGDGTRSRRSRAPRPAAVEAGRFRSRSRCFSSRAARDAFYNRGEVKSWLDRFRQLAGSGRRSVSGAELTIPDTVLELMRDNLDRSSKLIGKVRLRSVSGTARQNIIGKVPEGVWTEMCAKLNELEFAFTQVETDGYKVGGFIPVCNATLKDSDVNLGEEIIGMLLGAIGFALDKAIIYGLGPASKMPVGIVTRLAQTSQPAYWGVNQGAWTDLHSTNILKLNLTGKSGVEFFQPLLGAMGKADPDYSSGGTVWIMNRKTHMDLIARGLAFNAAGALVSGINNAMPVENGEIVELEFMPDNEFVGGFLDCFLLVEREGGTVAQSEHVRFIEDQTVFKATARYDGQPVIGEAFVAVNYANTDVTTSMSFTPDLANDALNGLIVTAAAGASGKTTVTIAGGKGSTGNTYAYALTAVTDGIVPGGKLKDLNDEFKRIASGDSIEAATNAPIVVVELTAKGQIVSCGTAKAVAGT